MPVDTSDYQELIDILAGRRAEIEAYCASSPNWEQLTEWATANSSYFAAIYGTYLEGEQRVKNSLPCLLDDLIEDGAQDTAVAYTRLMTELVPDQAPQPAAAETAPTLNPAENAEAWEYSRTPGTRYYIYHDDQYLYSDDKNAPLARWATVEERNEQAAARATEWETGSGVFYTSYENPALVQNVTHVFGESRDGPWILDQSQAADLLADRQTEASGVVAGQGSPVEPYFDTGHFTKYDNDVYYFGETADTTTWYPTYQELLDALTAGTPAEQEQAEEAEEDQLEAAEKVVAAPSLDDLLEQDQDPVITAPLAELGDEFVVDLNKARDELDLDALAAQLNQEQLEEALAAVAAAIAEGTPA